MSNSVRNRTRDKQIGLPLPGRPTFSSLVWLQTPLSPITSTYDHSELKEVTLLLLLMRNRVFTSNELIYLTNVPENEYFHSRWGSLIRCEVTKVWHGRFITNPFHFGGELCTKLRFLAVTEERWNRENRADLLRVLPLIKIFLM